MDPRDVAGVAGRFRTELSLAGAFTMAQSRWPYAEIPSTFSPFILTVYKSTQASCCTNDERYLIPAYFDHSSPQSISEAKLHSQSYVMAAGTTPSPPSLHPCSRLSHSLLPSPSTTSSPTLATHCLSQASTVAFASLSWIAYLAVF